MAGVELKQSVRLSDLTLPEGVEIPQLRKGGSHDLPVAAVNPARGGGRMADDEEEAQAQVEPEAEAEAETKAE